MTGTPAEDSYSNLGQASEVVQAAKDPHDEAFAVASEAQKSGGARERSVSASASENSESFKVVYERVALRRAASTSSEAVGALKKDDVVAGTVEIIDGVEWLHLSQKSTRKFALAGAPKRAFAMVDGKSVGLGPLLTMMDRKEEKKRPLTNQEKVELAASIQPSFPDQDPGMGSLWVVTGGHDKGGIVVRNGESVHSPELASKLMTGSTVEEIEVRGNRLHYKRIRGDGPDFGWVTFKTKEGQHYVEAFDTVG